MSLSFGGSLEMSQGGRYQPGGHRRLDHHPEGSEEALPRLNQESKGQVHFSKSSVGGTIWMSLLAIETRIFA